MSQLSSSTGVTSMLDEPSSPSTRPQRRQNTKGDSVNGGIRIPHVYISDVHFTSRSHFRDAYILPSLDNVMMKTGEAVIDGDLSHRTPASTSASFSSSSSSSSSLPKKAVLVSPWWISAARGGRKSLQHEPHFHTSCMECTAADYTCVPVTLGWRCVTCGQVEIEKLVWKEAMEAVKWRWKEEVRLLRRLKPLAPLLFPPPSQAQTPYQEDGSAAHDALSLKPQGRTSLPSRNSTLPLQRDGGGGDGGGGGAPPSPVSRTRTSVTRSSHGTSTAAGTVMAGAGGGQESRRRAQRAALLWETVYPASGDEGAMRREEDPQDLFIRPPPPLTERQAAKKKIQDRVQEVAPTCENCFLCPRCSGLSVGRALPNGWTCGGDVGTPHPETTHERHRGGNMLSSGAASWSLTTEPLEVRTARHSLCGLRMRLTADETHSLYAWCPNCHWCSGGGDAASSPSPSPPPPPPSSSESTALTTTGPSVFSSVDQLAEYCKTISLGQLIRRTYAWWRGRVTLFEALQPLWHEHLGKNAERENARAVFWSKMGWGSPAFSHNTSRGRSTAVAEKQRRAAALQQQSTGALGMTSFSSDSSISQEAWDRYIVWNAVRRRQAVEQRHRRSTSNAAVEEEKPEEEGKRNGKEGSSTSAITGGRSSRHGREQQDQRHPALIMDAIINDLKRKHELVVWGLAPEKDNDENDNDEEEWCREISLLATAAEMNDDVSALRKCPVMPMEGRRVKGSGADVSFSASHRFIPSGAGSTTADALFSSSHSRNATETSYRMPGLPGYCSAVKARDFGAALRQQYQLAKKKKKIEASPANDTTASSASRCTTEGSMYAISQALHGGVAPALTLNTNEAANIILFHRGMVGTTTTTGITTAAAASLTAQMEQLASVPVVRADATRTGESPVILHPLASTARLSAAPATTSTPLSVDPTHPSTLPVSSSSSPYVYGLPSSMKHRITAMLCVRSSSIRALLAEEQRRVAMLSGKKPSPEGNMVPSSDVPEITHIISTAPQQAAAVPPACADFVVLCDGEMEGGDVATIKQYWGEKFQQQQEQLREAERSLTAPSRTVSFTNASSDTRRTHLQQQRQTSGMTGGAAGDSSPAVMSPISLALASNHADDISGTTAAVGSTPHLLFTGHVTAASRLPFVEASVRHRVVKPKRPAKRQDTEKPTRKGGETPLGGDMPEVESEARRSRTAQCPPKDSDVSEKRVNGGRDPAGAVVETEDVLEEILHITFTNLGEEDIYIESVSLEHVSMNVMPSQQEHPSVLPKHHHGHPHPVHYPNHLSPSSTSSAVRNDHLGNAMYHLHGADRVSKCVAAAGRREQHRRRRRRPPFYASISPERKKKEEEEEMDHSPPATSTPTDRPLLSPWYRLAPRGGTVDNPGDTSLPLPHLTTPPSAESTDVMRWTLMRRGGQKWIEENDNRYPHQQEGMNSMNAPPSEESVREKGRHQRGESALRWIGLKVKALVPLSSELVSAVTPLARSLSVISASGEGGERRSLQVSGVSPPSEYHELEYGVTVVW